MRSGQEARGLFRLRAWVTIGKGCATFLARLGPAGKPVGKFGSLRRGYFRNPESAGSELVDERVFSAGGKYAPARDPCSQDDTLHPLAGERGVLGFRAEPRAVEHERPVGIEQDEIGRGALGETPIR